MTPYPAPNGKENPPKRRISVQMWVVLGSIFMVALIMYLSNSSSTIEITMRSFEKMLEKGHVEEVVVIRNQKMVEVTLTASALQMHEHSQRLDTRRSLTLSPSSPHYKITITSADAFVERFEALQTTLSPERQLEYKVEDRSDITSLIFNYGLVCLILVGFWLLLRRMSGGMGPGGQIFNIGKSQAALFDAQSKVKLTFSDVAGLDEAKEEVKEIVDFLKSPSKFTKLGGKIPKGALLVGAPGTGKTLLAKAVAGEAAVPFFSLSGSDFVEMFVGVGAARVRDLFKQAKEKAPCIIFIDEVDAIGRSRGKGQMPGSNDERENTLNSLLVEMDGFSTNSGVIILAATNRPDVLDMALLRPGRFDRQISIDKPDIRGREAIFKVHLQPIRTSKDLEVDRLAAQTPGFAGAEIANVCNEAALIAARKNKTRVEMNDFQDAIDRVIGGLEKKNKIISPGEKRIVAYHEAGHAIVGWFFEHADPLVKVSIVPRGLAALGYAQYLPKEQFLYQTEQLLDDMSMALGGRAAEDMVFGKISTGALSDLERVTKMAYSMVTVYGMNEKIGNISFYDSQQAEYIFNKPYSEATAQTIDLEVQGIVRSVYARAQQLLKEKRALLDMIAQNLLKKEILFQSDIERLIGKRPFPDRRSTPLPSNKSSHAKPSSKQSSNAKPSSKQSSNAKPSPSKSSNAKPSSKQSSNAKPSSKQSSNAKPSSSKSSHAKPSHAKPSSKQSSHAKPSPSKSSNAKPSSSKSSNAKPSSSKPSNAKPSSKQSSNAKPSSSKPSHAKPSSKQSSNAKPVRKGSNPQPKESIA